MTRDHPGALSPLYGHSLDLAGEIPCIRRPTSQKLGRLLGVASKHPKNSYRARRNAWRSRSIVLFHGIVAWSSPFLVGKGKAKSGG